MRRSKKFGHDDLGQMSIDFLMGMMIFLTAFIFIFIFIFDMITPFQSNSDELTMIADRIGMECVDNLLVNNGTCPNLINITKLCNMVSALNDANLTNYNNYCRSLGAYSDQSYNVNVSVIWSDNNKINGGPQYPIGSLNVGQSKRIVVDNYGKIGILYVTVW